MEDGAPISSEAFGYIQDLLCQRAGLMLAEDQSYLVDFRLLPLAQSEGFGSLADFLEHLRRQPFGEAHWKVIYAMANHETTFFRDFYPFEALRLFVLPEILAKRTAEGALNIWSSGCASGQEVYSLAMMLD